MKKFLLAGAALSALVAGPATAADLGTPVYRRAPVLAPVYSWSGFYIGGNIGGAWMRDNGNNTVPFATFFLPPNAAAINASGGFSGSGSSFIGGGQAGYNWQAGAVVFGIEADIDWLRTRSNSTVIVPYVTAPANGTRFDNSVGANWLATIRGRLGVASLANGAALIYVTGGAAIAGLTMSNATTELVPIPFGNCAAFHCGASSGDTTKTGYTVGGGLEWALSQNWSLKGEYLYADLGHVSATSSHFGVNAPAVAQPIYHDAHVTLQVARIGLNYKFGYVAPPVYK